MTRFILCGQAVSIWAEAMQGNSDKYYDEQDKINIRRLREVLDTLPRFCRQYFRGIEENTSTRTRLAYAYDLRTFFEFLHENNRSLAKTDIADYKLDMLDRIMRDDIEEYMEYINARELSAEEAAVGFDLNGDGDQEDTISLTIEYDPEAHPETNGYYGTYLDLYLAEFTESLQSYLDRLDYAEGWTWFDEDGNA